MQLVHMDVERLGSHDHCHLGPFSPGLNAIYGPQGSGKGKLLAWLREVVASEAYTTQTARTWPGGHNSLMRGAVEISHRDRRFVARVAGDGRAMGLDMLSPVQRDAFSSLANSGEFADTEQSLYRLAERLGINHYGQYAATESVSLQRLQTQLSEIEERLRQLPLPRATHDELISRRSQLESELSTIGSTSFEWSTVSAHGAALTGPRSYEHSRVVIEADWRDATEQVKALDRQEADIRSELAAMERFRPTIDVEGSYRQALQELNDRMNRWRQTLRDLKAHRERIEHDLTDARLDKQIGEHFSPTKEADPRGALKSLEAQIHATRNQLDSLVDRYGLPGRQNDYEVQRDKLGRTHVSFWNSQYAHSDTSQLPEALSRMQRDLHEVCQQLARQESHTVSETLRQQSLQLQRCESELLLSVERLIEERAALLQKIADSHHLTPEQLTLAFGDWCQCVDHPHLQDWLLSEKSTEIARPATEIEKRRLLLESIESLEGRRHALLMRIENCRRQLRDMDHARTSLVDFQQSPRGRRAEEIELELGRIRNDLTCWDERARLASEASEVRRLISEMAGKTVAHSAQFRQRIDWHIVELMGGAQRSAHRAAREQLVRRYDPVDGVVADRVEVRRDLEVPPAIVRLAIRLAIAESMAARGEAISLILDRSLDGVEVDTQRFAVSHLAAVASQGQQVVLLTADERVAHLVREFRGYVGEMPVAGSPTVAIDINRHLSALANDHEAEKWYSEPLRTEPIRRPPARGDYYLSDRSFIDELPSIDAPSAARCRAAGIDRIGDLLDTDSRWLAEQIRLDGVSSPLVSSWQAEARLLCAVRRLRPFDARVLVGAGIRDAQQLAGMHPSQLLDRVERFLATDRGRQILRSGNSYELSRITSWIASAKGGAGRYYRTSLEDADAWTGEAIAANDFSMERPFTERHRDLDQRPSAARTASRSSTPRSAAAFPVISRTGESHRHRTKRDRTASRDQRRRGEREPQRATRPLENAVKVVNENSNGSAKLRFYLELASPVVDAPSIGPRMAARLEKMGIHTVDQLLAANAETLADKINLQRVDDTTIRAWQEQARLVCRIPNLRGHDAQLLVACDLTSPEELANMNPTTVLSQVLVIAESVEGQRILRGSKLPDLAEINDWIAWASHCRSLNAA
jgi:hypothetical protein